MKYNQAQWGNPIFQIGSIDHSENVMPHEVRRHIYL